MDSNLSFEFVAYELVIVSWLSACLITRASYYVSWYQSRFSPVLLIAESPWEINQFTRADLEGITAAFTTSLTALTNQMTALTTQLNNNAANNNINQRRDMREEHNNRQRGGVNQAGDSSSSEEE